MPSSECLLSWILASYLTKAQPEENESHIHWLIFHTGEVSEPWHKTMVDMFFFCEMYIWNSYLYCGFRWKRRVLIAVNFQFKQLKGRSLRNTRASSGLEPPEVTGSNPVEALIFLRLLPSNCLNWKFTAMISLHFHFFPPCFKAEASVSEQRN